MSRRIDRVSLTAGLVVIGLGGQDEAMARGVARGQRGMFFGSRVGGWIARSPEDSEDSLDGHRLGDDGAIGEASPATTTDAKVDLEGSS